VRLLLFPRSPSCRLIPIELFPATVRGPSNLRSMGFAHAGVIFFTCFSAPVPGFACPFFAPRIPSHTVIAKVSYAWMRPHTQACAFSLSVPSTLSPAAVSPPDPLLVGTASSASTLWPLDPGLTFFFLVRLYFSYPQDAQGFPLSAHSSALSEHQPRSCP